jgi:hypothetical protein
LLVFAAPFDVQEAAHCGRGVCDKRKIVRIAVKSTDLPRWRGV